MLIYITLYWLLTPVPSAPIHSTELVVCHLQSLKCAVLVLPKNATMCYQFDRFRSYRPPELLRLRFFRSGDGERSRRLVGESKSCSVVRMATLRSRVALVRWLFRRVGDVEGGGVGRLGGFKFSRLCDRDTAAAAAVAAPAVEEEEGGEWR